MHVQTQADHEDVRTTEGQGVSACISFIHKSKRCLDTKRCWSPDQSKAADRDMRSQKASFQSGIFLWCIVMCEPNKDTWLQVPIQEKCIAPKCYLNVWVIQSTTFFCLFNLKKYPKHTKLERIQNHT